MSDVFNELFEVIKSRQQQPQEGSYTCYLFEKGLDKILKKCGEECAEVIIAAKNQDIQELTGEICDLMYHLMVLMAVKEVPMEQVAEELQKRGRKIGNLKQFHSVDKES